MSGEIIAIIGAAIALAAVIVPGQRGMRNDIKHLLTKTSGLDGRLDAMDGRLDAMDGRLDAMDGRLGAVEGRLGAVEREVATVRTEVAQLETRLTSCIGKLEAELKERLARLEGYFEAMGGGERAIRERAAK
ncbi:MAG: hypothetical protein OXN85_01830 [Gemmatimonadetes bacterium]|nr:hypothetical protein [Candidatus Palauibacter australiensis]